jgi:hypothetical protein
MNTTRCRAVRITRFNSSAENGFFRIAALEEVSCKCYRLIREQEEGLVGLKSFVQESGHQSTFI